MSDLSRAIDPLISGFRDPALGELWRAEVERFEFDERDQEAARCAELAEELQYLLDDVEVDDEMVEAYAEWEWFVWERSIWLPLEQSCYEGVLLPTEQRAIRLASCPEELLNPLRWFFELCPPLMKAYIALHTFVIVRSERARRTGSSEWRPRHGKPIPTSPPRYGWRFVPRRYTG